MTRYINADGLKIEFMNLDLDHCQGTDYREANQVIDDYPTANVTKLVHGHWVDHKADTCGGRGCDTKEYSLCHAEQRYLLDDNYCPNCGALMDEEV